MYCVHTKICNRVDIDNTIRFLIHLLGLCTFQCGSQRSVTKIMVIGQRPLIGVVAVCKVAQIIFYKSVLAITWRQ